MKSVLYILVMTASLSCFAQNAAPKNELGMNLYGFEYFLNPKIYGNGFQPFYFSGAQYKRQIRENYNLRFAGQYFTRSRSDAGTLLVQSLILAQDGNYAYNIDEKGFETRAGVERSFSKKKVRPFVFADLVYRYTNIQASFLSNGEWLKESTEKHYGGGLCGIGVKYFPISQIYISLESSIGYYKNFGQHSKGASETIFSPVKTVAFGVRF